MNPPFTRNVTRESAYAGTYAAAFAAFEASKEDQKLMAKRMNALKKDTCYHGNAGIASAFAALADKKIRPGGVLALVLPLSIATGLAWREFREMLAREYTDVSILSIAASGRDMSFSSDTGMAEALVIARKAFANEPPNEQVRFTSLRHRPQGLANASLLALGASEDNQVRGIEDGPYGGTPLW